MLKYIKFSVYRIDVEPDSITWVRMIIQPLRFLNFVVDSKTLCERLFDIIYTATDNIVCLNFLYFYVFKR